MEDRGWLSIATVRTSSVLIRQIAIIDRRDGATVDLFDITAVADPFCARGRKTLRDVAMKRRITPGTARVVNANRFVHLDFAAHRFRWHERDFAEGNPDVGMQLTGDVDLSGVR